MKNKRGISQLADIIFSLILFMLLFVILMFVMGTAKMQVAAEVTAANTVFICQNDLGAAMQLYSSEEQIRDILVRNYIEENYTDFDSEIKSTFNEVAGENKWEVKIIHGQEELHKVGEQMMRNSELCSILVPVSCDTSGAEDLEEYEQELIKCNLEVQLALGHE